jgi:MFS family permease
MSQATWDCGDHLHGSHVNQDEFFSYASLALHLPPLFPQDDPIAASLLTWLIFATSFVVRPVGAALFGHLGDKIGRKTTFITTLLLMGVATSLMGLLPTYAEIGLAAPPS